MRLIITIFILTCFSLHLKAPPFKVIYLTTGEKIMPYEAVMRAVAQVESSGNHLAVGDKNLKLWSYGKWQIRQSRLDDYHKQTGIYYRAEEMTDTIKARQVFMFYASQFDYRDIERISRCWNGGEKGMSYKSTIKYYHKVNREYNRFDKLFKEADSVFTKKHSDISQ